MAYSSTIQGGCKSITLLLLPAMKLQREGVHHKKSHSGRIEIKGFGSKAHLGWAVAEVDGHNRGIRIEKNMERNWSRVRASITENPFLGHTHMLSLTTRDGTDITNPLKGSQLMV